MVLSEIKVYLRKNRRVMLADIATHFDLEPDALRGMLQKWVSKGKVRKLAADTGCSTGCCKCDPATLEFYEWIDSGR